MKKIIISSSLFLLPVVALAAESDFSQLDSIVTSIGDTVSAAIPVAIGIAILGFMWGLAKYVFGGAEEKDKGKSIMIGGLIAIFVMLSLWGIIAFFQNLIGVEGGTQNLPGFDF